MKGEVQYLPLYINSQVVSAEPNFSKERKRATPEKTEEKRCNALLLTVWVWGLNVRSNYSQQPFKPNLDQKQSADNRKVFALLNSLKAERRKEGKSQSLEWVSRGYQLTRSKGRRRLLKWAASTSVTAGSGHRKHSGEIRHHPDASKSIWDYRRRSKCQHSEELKGDTISPVDAFYGFNSSKNGNC